MNRREKILKKLNESGLDGLLFASGANFQYVVESNSYFWQRYCFNLDEPVAGARIIPEAMVYLNKDGKSTILTTPLLKEHFDTTLNDVVVSYMDQFEDELTKIIDGKKIGIGRDCEAWFRKTLNVKLIEVEDIFYDLRRIKDEKEIALMTKLGKFTDDAVMYVVNNLKMGMSQREAENLLVKYGYDHGVSDFSFPPTVGFKTQNTITTRDVEYYDREWKLQPQTSIAFDVGYMNKGYCSDWGRSVYVGKAPDICKKGYEALNKSIEYMASQIVPYKTNINELYGLVMKKVDELGMLDYLRYKDVQMLGHQIGIDCHEFPMVNKDFDFVIKPGMTFAVEPKMWFENEMYMRVEDIVLITEEGAEILTKFPRDLFEIEVK